VTLVASMPHDAGGLPRHGATVRPVAPGNCRER
jgi:hypothetical protein